MESRRERARDDARLGSPALRIAFDVTSCAKPERGGIGGYGWAVVRACARRAPEHDYVLCVRMNRWMARRRVADLLPGHRVHLLIDSLPESLLGHVDVLHGIGVRLPRAGPFAKVVTLHDINVFEFPALSEPRWRKKRQWRIRQTLRRADLVISYSEQGADALGLHLGVSRDRVRVVPIGVDTEVFRPRPAEETAAVLARHELVDRPFVLHVGRLSPRKNQVGLIRAFARADLPSDWVLVLAGPRDDDAKILADAGRAAGLDEQRLRLPGYVGEDQFPALLTACSLYACPSLHEGFGIPVLEAQACGAPVLCSRRGALIETLGDCGVLFDPTDEAAFADAIGELARDDALRADLARRGPDRVVREFAWDRVAEKTLAVHAEAAALVRD